MLRFLLIDSQICLYHNQVLITNSIWLKTSFSFFFYWRWKWFNLENYSWNVNIFTFTFWTRFWTSIPHFSTKFERKWSSQFWEIKYYIKAALPILKCIPIYLEPFGIHCICIKYIQIGIVLWIHHGLQYQINFNDGVQSLI